MQTTSRGEFTFLNDSPLSNQYVVTNTTRCEHCTMAYCNVITDINFVGVWWLEFYVGNDYGAVLNISVFSNWHCVSVASENGIVPDLLSNTNWMLNSVAGKIKIWEQMSIHINYRRITLDRNCTDNSSTWGDEDFTLNGGVLICWINSYLHEMHFLFSVAVMTTIWREVDDEFFFADVRSSYDEPSQINSWQLYVSWRCPCKSHCLQFLVRDGPSLDQSLSKLVRRGYQYDSWFVSRRCKKNSLRMWL